MNKHKDEIDSNKIGNLITYIYQRIDPFRKSKGNGVF